MLLTLYSVEDVRGQRIILPTVRGHVDRGFHYVAERFVKSGIRVSVWLLHVLLEHGVKRLMKTLVDTMHSIEEQIERLIRQHRSMHNRSREERTRNHLDDIAEHKLESALSEKEISKRKSH